MTKLIGQETATHITEDQLSDQAKFERTIASAAIDALLGSLHGSEWADHPRVVTVIISGTLEDAICSTADPEVIVRIFNRILSAQPTEENALIVTPPHVSSSIPKGN